MSHTVNKGALVHVYFRNDLGVLLFEHVRIERIRYLILIFMKINENIINKRKITEKNHRKNNGVYLQNY